LVSTLHFVCRLPTNPPDVDRSLIEERAKIDHSVTFKPHALGVHAL
jgi:hypothetical protein